MVPADGARNDDAVDVGQDLLEGFAGFRRGGGHRGDDCARFRGGRDAHFLDVLTVIGDPVRDLVEMFAKNVCGDVAELGDWCG